VFVHWFFEEAENELPNSYSKYLLDEEEEEEEEEKKNSFFFVFSCIHIIIYKVADGRYTRTSLSVPIVRSRSIVIFSIE